MLPGWIVEKHLKPADVNATVRFHKLTVRFECQAHFLGAKETHVLDIQVPQVVPLEQFVGKKNLVLKRQWLGADLECKTVNKGTILSIQKVRLGSF